MIAWLRASHKTLKDSDPAGPGLLTLPFQGAERSSLKSSAVEDSETSFEVSMTGGLYDS